jgi:hypothetical protein
MKHFEKGFTVFVNISLKILFFLILIGSAVLSFRVFEKLSAAEIVKLLLVNLLLISVCLGAGYIFRKYLRIRKSCTMAIVIILCISLILRIAWILMVDTKPFSDFRVIYDCGKKFIDGEYWVFKGDSYIGRFPHLTILTMYLGLFQKIFTNALLAIKSVNVILSTVSVYIIYLIGTEQYNDKEKGIWMALLTSFFPPFIIYNSVVCSENLAIPFLLGSIYIFIMVIKGKMNIIYFLLSGFLLSIGNLFRMVAYVIVIAYLMYMAIYWDRRKFAQSCALILLSFFIPLFGTSAALIRSGITEYPLWRGSEPAVVSALKGTNINALGSWNEEDSKIPEIYNYDYEKVETAAMSIIKDRLTTTPFYKLVGFYIAKFIVQWSSGDFSAVSWAAAGSGYLGKTAELFSQILFITVVLYIFRGLFNHEQYLENKIVNLFYIIFCGYGLLYLVTEQQPRYGYIISWAFIILAFTSPKAAFTVKRNKVRNIKLTT